MRGALIYTRKGRLVHSGQAVLAYPTTSPAGGCLGKAPGDNFLRTAPLENRELGTSLMPDLLRTVCGIYEVETKPGNSRVCYGKRKRGSKRARTADISYTAVPRSGAPLSHHTLQRERHRLSQQRN